MVLLGSARHRRAAFASLAVLALAAGACSSSKNSTSSNNTNGGTTPTFKGTVTIMTIAPTGAQEGNHPEDQFAVTAAANAANKAGGVGGYKVNVVWCNDQGQAQAAAQCAQQAVSQHVLAVVASNSVYGDSINPVLEAAGIPNIANSPIEGSDYTSKVSFPIDAGGISNFQGDVFALAKLGYSKIGVVVLDVTSASTITNSLSAALKVAKTPSGTPVTATGVVKIPITASDFTPYAQALKNQGAQAVVAVESPQQIEGLMKADQTLGYKLVFSCGANNFAQSDATLIGGLGTMIGTLDIPPATGDSPAAKQFRADMTAAKAAGVPGEYQISAPAFSDWVGFQAFKAVASTVTGALTPANLLSALNAASSVDVANGVLPQPWNPSQAAAGPTRITQNSVYVMKLASDGSWSLALPTPIDVVAALKG